MVTHNVLWFFVGILVSGANLHTTSEWRYVRNARVDMRSRGGRNRDSPHSALAGTFRARYDRVVRIRHIKGIVVRHRRHRLATRDHWRWVFQMAAYAVVNGIRTWYDERGNGEPLVMLHPGATDAQAFAPNLEALAERFHLFLPERRGHGHTPDADGPYSYEVMAQDTIQFLVQIVGGASRLLGMSDGAVVALLVAHKRPDLVQRLICIAGVFHISGWVEGATDPMVEPPAFQIASYKELSPDPIDHLPVVVQKLNEMHAKGPRLTWHDLKNIPCRTLVMVGDDDEVRLEHAIDFYRGLPNGELAIAPGDLAWFARGKAGPLQQDHA